MIGKFIENGRRHPLLNKIGWQNWNTLFTFLSTYINLQDPPCSSMLYVLKMSVHDRFRQHRCVSRADTEILGMVDCLIVGTAVNQILVESIVNETYSVIATMSWRAKSGFRDSEAVKKRYNSRRCFVSGLRGVFSMHMFSPFLHTVTKAGVAHCSKGVHVIYSWFSFVHPYSLIFSDLNYWHVMSAKRDFWLAVKNVYVSLTLKAPVPVKQLESVWVCCCSPGNLLMFREGSNNGWAW